jgi:hypothetical protein
MFDKARRLYQLQKKARAIQKELRSTEIEAKSGDGKISVVFNGEQKIQDIKIDESLLSSGNKGELEKNLKNTITEAISRAQAVAAEKMKAITGDLNIPGM